MAVSGQQCPERPTILGADGLKTGITDIEGAAAPCAPCYWSSNRAQSKAEVDFLYEADGTLISLEVKSDRNVHSRSLAQFAQLFGIKRCQRLSPASSEHQGRLVNLTLFMADMLLRVLWANHQGTGSLAGPPSAIWMS